MSQELTNAEADIYRGVDRTDPPQHAKLIPGWQRPTPAPAGTKHLVALGGPATVDGKKIPFLWELGYFNPDSGDFGVDEEDAQVSWPWVEGFFPQASDWDAIGIPHMM